MEPLSKPQYKLLKRIYRVKSVKLDSLNDVEKDICKYLLVNSFIKSRKQLGHTMEDMYNSKELPANIEITQAGEAALYDFRSKFYKWWIPVFISAVSVALSAVSIISQVVQLLGR